MFGSGSDKTYLILAAFDFFLAQLPSRSALPAFGIRPRGMN
jgi:hypothetical protein